MARPASRANGTRGGNPALRLAAIRQFHTYLGVFIAPSILFFAMTGAWQLFSLHEAHGGYRPPPLIEKLGSVHKDQRFTAKAKHAAARAQAEHHAEADTDADHDHDHDHAAAPAKGLPMQTLALKFLFLGVAISLIVSTCLGVWMAVTASRRKGPIWALLILGAVLPVLILAV